MECLLGLRFDNFVLLAADATEAVSIVVNKQDADKFHNLSDHILMAVSGEAGDTSVFADYINKNIFLYKMRNDYDLSPKAASHFTRRTLAEALRTRSAYQCNLLIGGYDPVDKKAQLYYLDYLASMVELPYCAHGYGGYFSLSAMDAYHRPDMTFEEGMEVMKKCIKEVAKRLIINLPAFRIKMVDANGIRDVGEIHAKDL